MFPPPPILRNYRVVYLVLKTTSATCIRIQTAPASFGRENGGPALKPFSLTAWAAVATCLGVAIAPASAPAQDAGKAALPSSDQILARYETFLGGRAALARVTTRTTISRRLEYSAPPADTVLV